MGKRHTSVSAKNQVWWCCECTAIPTARHQGCCLREEISYGEALEVGRSVMFRRQLLRVKEKKESKGTCVVQETANARKQAAAQARVGLRRTGTTRAPRGTSRYGRTYCYEQLQGEYGTPAAASSFHAATLRKTPSGKASTLGNDGSRDGLLA